MPLTVGPIRVVVDDPRPGHSEVYVTSTMTLAWAAAREYLVTMWRRPGATIAITAGAAVVWTWRGWNRNSQGESWTEWRAEREAVIA